METIFFYVVDALILLSFFGWLFSTIRYGIKVKKSHLEKDKRKEINEKVKERKLWKTPTNIFKVLLVLSIVLIAFGTMLFVLYAIFMMFMLVISLFAAILSHDKAENVSAFFETISNIIFGYWKYVGIASFPVLIASTTFFMIRQCFLNKLKLQMVDENMKDIPEK